MHIMPTYRPPPRDIVAVSREMVYGEFLDTNQKNKILLDSPVVQVHTGHSGMYPSPVSSKTTKKIGGAEENVNKRIDFEENNQLQFSSIRELKIGNMKSSTNQNIQNKQNLQCLDDNSPVFINTRSAMK